MIPFYSIQWRAMGCNVLVQLQTTEDGEELLGQLPARLDAYEQALSRFRQDSDLMKLNQQAGRWVPVSAVLLENVQIAREAARMTEGWFNPLILPALLANGYDRSFDQMGTTVTVYPGSPARSWHLIEIDTETSRVRIPESSALDLGGIAKGWAAAQLADKLAGHGACSVNIGGDIALRGAPLNQDGWLIDIRDPLSHEIFTRIHLADTSIVSSGIDYRRWRTTQGDIRHHIMNPFTGYPAQTDLFGATVVCPDAASAEAYAKVLLLLGSRRGLEWMEQHAQVATLLFKKDGEVLSNSAFTRLIEERMYS